VISCIYTCCANSDRLVLRKKLAIDFLVVSIFPDTMAPHIASVITTIFIILSSSKVHNGTILVPAYLGFFVKWLLNKCCHWLYMWQAYSGCLGKGAVKGFVVAIKSSNAQITILGKKRVSRQLTASLIRLLQWCDIVMFHQC